MLRIDAKKLLRYSPEELQERLCGDFILVFEDGEVVSNEREVVYSSYLWELHRQFPKTPLLLSHHVTCTYKDGEPPADMHLRLVSNIYWYIFRLYQNTYQDHTQLIDRLSKLSYEAINRLYNFTSIHTAAWATSLDVVDFIAFTKCPDIEQALEAVEPSEAGIETANRIVMSAIKEDPRFRENPLAVAIRTGISRTGQALQMLGPRGYLTDMDSHLFPYPIMSSYTKGVRTLYDSLIESRSAAKSLINAETPLQNSEYFSRRQQLLCQYIRNLHYGDCGSTRYLNWLVRGASKMDGKDSRGDLPTIVGKYYLDDDGELKAVQMSDTHLIGKRIRMRSFVAGCNHPDPYGVCMTCYGEAGLGIPARTNLGHATCVSLMAIVSQLILSTKHFDGSSTVEGIYLNDFDKQYLSAEPNGSEYYLSDRLRKKKKVVLKVRHDDALGLSDVHLVDDVRSLNITRTSEFTTIGLSLSDERSTEKLSLDVFVNNRKSSFSHDFLNYAKRHGYNINDNNEYEFDLSDWDDKKPMLELPMSHFNMSDFQKVLEHLLESTNKKGEASGKICSPEDFIMTFHDTVNRRLEVNLSVLEVVAFATMVVDADEHNFALPKGWTDKNVGVMESVMSGRSLSAQMAYEKHRQTFLDPASYIKTNRLDHIFDHVFMPEYFNQHPHAEF